jgi:adenosylcobinamide-GDP ribazoletransferase
VHEQDRLLSPADFGAAFGLLTRLPVGFSARGARSVWLWPLVGLAVGAIGTLAGGLAVWLGVPVGAAAVLVIAVQVMITGAMHEDGLADSADGLFGGTSRDHALAIMKDSRIGTFGALALILTMLARWSLISLLLTGPWAAMVLVSALSRLPMAVLMTALPHARSGGLSVMTGRPHRPEVALAALIALALCVPVAGWATFSVAAVLLFTTLAMGWLANRKIGGQTGDILGATQQISDVALLALFAGLSGQMT